MLAADYRGLRRRERPFISTSKLLMNKEATMKRIFLIPILMLGAANIGIANAQTASQVVSTAVSTAVSQATNAAVRQAAQDALKGSAGSNEAKKLTNEAKSRVKKAH